MNRKVLKSILAKKFDDFLGSITDEKVRKLVEKNSIITGGAIVSLLQNEKPNDFDIYFTNRETVLAVSGYYVAAFNKRMKEKGGRTDAEVLEIKGRVKIFIKSSGVADTEKSSEKQLAEFVDLADSVSEKELESGKDRPKYRVVFLSANAVTLSDKVQLIIRFYGNAEEIHSNYDFVHCTSYWQSWDQRLVLRSEALEMILYKDLRYVGSKYPIASMVRARKFIKRGWGINAGQLLKMAFQVSKLDLENIATLEDQLTGVDASYFDQLIRALKKKQEKDPECRLESQYIVSIIDRIM